MSLCAPHTHAHTRRLSKEKPKPETQQRTADRFPHTSIPYMGGGPPGAEKPIATLENSNFLLKLQMKLFCTHTYTHTRTQTVFK